MVYLFSMAYGMWHIFLSHQVHTFSILMMWHLRHGIAHTFSILMMVIPKGDDHQKTTFACLNFFRHSLYHILFSLPWAFFWYMTHGMFSIDLQFANFPLLMTWKWVITWHDNIFDDFHIQFGVWWWLVTHPLQYGIWHVAYLLISPSSYFLYLGDVALDSIRWLILSCNFFCWHHIQFISYMV